MDLWSFEHLQSLWNVQCSLPQIFSDYVQEKYPTAFLPFLQFPYSIHETLCYILFMKSVQETLWYGKNCTVLLKGNMVSPRSLLKVGPK